MVPPGRGARQGGIEDQGHPVRANALDPCGSSKPAGAAFMGLLTASPQV